MKQNSPITIHLKPIALFVMQLATPRLQRTALTLVLVLVPHLYELDTALHSANAALKRRGDDVLHPNLSVSDRGGSGGSGGGLAGSNTSRSTSGRSVTTVVALVAVLQVRRRPHLLLVRAELHLEVLHVTLKRVEVIMPPRGLDVQDVVPDTLWEQSRCKD
jgi:hypothetical protein